MTDNTLPVSPLAIIVLAAGKGTRMKSDLHKVLHPIAGRPMLMHLMASAAGLAPARQVVVAGHGRDQLEKALGTSATIAVQDPQLGTAHAVQQAEGALAGFDGDVLILYGDVPFVRTETMQAMIARLHEPDSPAAVVLGFEPDDALQYGRVIAQQGRIMKMVEHKDATEAERQCRTCNSGLMALRSADLFGLLARVGNDNAQGEYYLPDVVNIAIADGRTCAVVVTDDADEVAAGLGQPRLLHVECAELAERIGAEQDLVCIVIGHDDLGPVDHRRGDKVQRVGAQRQGVPLLDDDAAVRVVGAEIGLHHVERLGRRDDGRAGVRLRERGDGAGMVRLHVLHDQVVGRTLAQCGGDLGRGQCQRCIPGRDQRGHAGRFAHDVTQVGVVRGAGPGDDGCGGDACRRGDRARGLDRDHAAGEEWIGHGTRCS